MWLLSLSHQRVAIDNKMSRGKTTKTRHDAMRCGPEKRLINVLLIINVTAEKSCKILYKIIYIYMYINE